MLKVVCEAPTTEEAAGPNLAPWVRSSADVVNSTRRLLTRLERHVASIQVILDVSHEGVTSSRKLLAAVATSNPRR